MPLIIVVELTRCLILSILIELLPEQTWCRCIRQRYSISIEEEILPLYWYLLIIITCFGEVIRHICICRTVTCKVEHKSWMFEIIIHACISLSETLITEHTEHRTTLKRQLILVGNLGINPEANCSFPLIFRLIVIPHIIITANTTTNLFLLFISQDYSQIVLGNALGVFICAISKILIIHSEYRVFKHTSFTTIVQILALIIIFIMLRCCLIGCHITFFSYDLYTTIRCYISPNKITFVISYLSFCHTRFIKILEILEEHTISSRIKESDVCRSLEVCIRINTCICKYYITRICILTRITPFHEFPLSARNCVICHGITLTNLCS